tara:strand:+ start:21357 stop:24812 length:3456 start_codon:yes stop_codon:yes gene_type:complete
MTTIRNPFIHLRVSSEYSIVRGLSRVKNIVDAAIADNMPAVALTDLNNMFGVVKFITYAESRGIKGIIGSVLRIQDLQGQLSEILCLAKNNIGYRNLINLISTSQQQIKNDNNYIFYSDLINNKDGLFLILGGQRSELFNLIENHKLDEAEQYASKYKELFGDSLLIESQLIGSKSQKNISIKLMGLASQLDIPVIATNDAMFIKKQDFDIHEIKVCINTTDTLNNPNRKKEFSSDQYFKSSSEMYTLYKGYEEAVQNTFELAKLCNVTISTGLPVLPEYPVPANHTFDSFLADEAQKHLERYINNFDADKQLQYKERLDYEIAAIHKTGFSSYFLIVADFIQWSRDNNVPVGPGRGSGAGSLVAFSLGITELDPIEHDLLFERFINPERVSMPDFDIDFCMEQRDQVIQYVSNRYGQDAVSQIATFGTMAARGVVRDVARALGKPYALGDRIAKMIPAAPGITLKQAIKENSIFKKMISEDGEVSEIIDLSFELEGIARNVGKHAGGIVIAKGKITDFCPTYIDHESNSIMTQFDKDDVETIGLVKFDFLGLRTLTVIDKAVEEINKDLIKKKKNSLDIKSIPLDDQNVFQFLSSGKTTAVFQLESGGMRDLIRKLKPSKFEEIVALLALFRPGPLRQKMHEKFVDRKHGNIAVSYPHPLLEPVLKETYGVILYQEQVMQTAQVLAGYSLGQADILRRAMGKKKADEMAEQKEIFVEGCQKVNQINSSTAENIFDLIETFAEYGFNKSHSAAYALISYQTAYLKTYYPEYFMASVLSSELGNTDKIADLLKECESMEIKVLPPDINSSFKNFQVNKDNNIEYGLGAIKGVTGAYVDHLISTRSNSKINDLFDLTKKTDIRIGGKGTIEAFSKAGAFDSITPSRSIAIAALEDILKEGQRRSSKMNNTDLFSEIEENFNPYEKYKDVSDISQDLKLEYEKQSFGFYFSGHPIRSMQEIIKHIRTHEIGSITSNINNIAVAGLINKSRTIQDKSGNQIMFISFDDGTGSMEGIVPAKLFEENHKDLKNGSILIFKGDAEYDNYKSQQLGESSFKLNIKHIEILKETLTHRSKAILVDLTSLSDDDIKSSIEELKKLNGNFWQAENCAIKLKVNNDGTEAIIDLGSEYTIMPSTENLDLIHRIFKTEKVSIIQ